MLLPPSIPTEKKINLKTNNHKMTTPLSKVDVKNFIIMSSIS
jgi:hypothetical protein